MQAKKPEHCPLNTRKDAKKRGKRKDFPFNFSVYFAYLAGKILSCHAACHICGKVATHVGSQVATFPVAG